MKQLFLIVMATLMSMSGMAQNTIQLPAPKYDKKAR